MLATLPVHRAAVLAPTQADSRRRDHRRRRVRDDGPPRDEAHVARQACRLLDRARGTRRRPRRRAYSLVSLIGIGLSILWLVYVNTHPSTTELGRRPGSTAFEPLRQRARRTRPSRAVLVLRFSAGLFFATADALQDRLRQAALTDRSPSRFVSWSSTSEASTSSTPRVRQRSSRSPCPGGETPSMCGSHASSRPCFRSRSGRRHRGVGS